MTWIVVPLTAVTRSCDLYASLDEAVLRDREPRVHAVRNAQLREREQRPKRHGAALHVRVHVEHAEERFPDSCRPCRTSRLCRPTRGARRRWPRGAIACKCKMPASRVALPRATAKNAPAPSWPSARSPKKRLPMPCDLASASIALRYAAIVNTFGGRAVNQRAALLPSACACADARSALIVRANSRTVDGRAGRGVFAADLNAGSANGRARARPRGSRQPRASAPASRPGEHDAERARFVAQAFADRPWRPTSTQRSPAAAANVADGQARCALVRSARAREVVAVAARSRERRRELLAVRQVERPASPCRELRRRAHGPSGRASRASARASLPSRER